MNKILDKIIEVALYHPFAFALAELAGWLVIRDLRRWARGFRVESSMGVKNDVG